MSDKDRPKADDGGGADDEDREGPAAETEGKCEGCGRKGKKLPFFRLRKKSKKLLHQKQKQKQKGVFVNSRGWGRRANAGGGWCCLCVRQPKTLDSSDRLKDFSHGNRFRASTRADEHSPSTKIGLKTRSF